MNKAAGKAQKRALKREAKTLGEHVRMTRAEFYQLEGYRLNFIEACSQRDALLEKLATARCVLKRLESHLLLNLLTPPTEENTRMQIEALRSAL